MTGRNSRPCGAKAKPKPDGWYPGAGVVTMSPNITGSALRGIGADIPGRTWGPGFYGDGTRPKASSIFKSKPKPPPRKIYRHVYGSTHPDLDCGEADRLINFLRGRDEPPCPKCPCAPRGLPKFSIFDHNLVNEGGLPGNMSRWRENPGDNFPRDYDACITGCDRARGIRNLVSKLNTWYTGIDRSGEGHPDNKPGGAENNYILGGGFVGGDGYDCGYPKTSFRHCPLTCDPIKNTDGGRRCLKPVCLHTSKWGGFGGGTYTRSDPRDCQTYGPHLPKAWIPGPEDIRNPDRFRMRPLEIVPKMDYQLPDSLFKRLHENNDKDLM